MPTVKPVGNVIGFATMGASTMKDIGDSLVPILKNDPNKAANVKVANGGEGNQRIDAWADPKSSAWSMFANSLKGAGLSPGQLRVIWLMAIQDAGTGLDFESQVSQNVTWMSQTLDNIKAKYPSVQIVYISGHHYEGYYFDNKGNPVEPGVYWNAWTVKRIMTLRQKRTDPWVSWGADVWANGVGSDCVAGPPAYGRAYDGLEWLQSDFTSDGLHPTPQVAGKASRLMLAFLHSDSSAHRYRK
jgi:hypothetical protein